MKKKKKNVLPGVKIKKDEADLDEEDIQYNEWEDEWPEEIDFSYLEDLREYEKDDL